MMESQMAVLCQECGKECWKVKGYAIYGYGRHTDKLWFWRCECEAYVGCRLNTDIALGTAAGPVLRRKRKAVHIVFDFLWQQKVEGQKVSRSVAITAAYNWLAGQMGLSEVVRIESMNVEQCEMAVRICKPYHDRLREQLDRIIYGS